MSRVTLHGVVSPEIDLVGGGRDPRVLGEA
jgi:hypothetical protein